MLGASSIQEQTHVLRLGVRVRGVLRERPLPLQIQVILHGDNRGMMKRQTLVLDEVSQRLGGAGIPSCRPGIGTLLLLVAEGGLSGGLRGRRIVRPQTTI